MTVSQAEVDAALYTIADQQAADTLALAFGEMRALLAETKGSIEALIAFQTEMTSALMELESENRDLREAIKAVSDWKKLQ